MWHLRFSCRVRFTNRWRRRGLDETTTIKEHHEENVAPFFSMYLLCLSLLIRFNNINLIELWVTQNVFYKQM